jgi:hypothetical protein
MACDLEALFSVEQKLRMIFANPSFVRSRTRLKLVGGQGPRPLPFQAINSLSDPQQHLLQALATSMSLLGLQQPLAGSFARWCSGHNADFDMEAASSALKQLLLHLRLPKGHVNAIYADSRALGQLIRKHGVLDDPAMTGVEHEMDCTSTLTAASVTRTFTSSAMTTDDASALPSPSVTRTFTSSAFSVKACTWELKVLKFDISRANGKYKTTALHLHIHDGFFSPRLQPHANSPKDGWYIRARLGQNADLQSSDHWISAVFPKSVRVSVTPNLSFVEELTPQLASASDQEVIAHLQEFYLTIELWRHKPKRQDFLLCVFRATLNNPSLGLAAAIVTLQPLPAGDSSLQKPTSGSVPTSDFAMCATVELSMTRRRAAEPPKTACESPRAEAFPSFEDTVVLRTELDSEVAVLRNWTFMSAAAALLVQHNAPTAAVKTVMLLYCFTSGFAVAHARDCFLIARALNMKCDHGPLVNALELLLQLNEAEEPRNYSAQDVYSLVDTTRISLRSGAVDLIIMAARHHMDNIMARSHEQQRMCLPVLLKIVSMKCSFDERDRSVMDSLMVQLHFTIQSWNTFTMQSIRRMQIVLDASNPQMQNLLTVSNMFRIVSQELEFQLAEIAPLYPPDARPKQTIAHNLCSHLALCAQAFIIERSDNDTFDSDLLIQVPRFKAQFATSRAETSFAAF